MLYGRTCHVFHCPKPLSSALWPLLFVPCRPHGNICTSTSTVGSRGYVVLLCNSTNRIADVSGMAGTSPHAFHSRPRSCSPSAPAGGRTPNICSVVMCSRNYRLCHAALLHYKQGSRLPWAPTVLLAVAYLQTTARLPPAAGGWKVPALGQGPFQT